LKDASSTSLYGSRAANGVIMITTKKGKKGNDNFTFTAQHGTASRALPEYLRLGPEKYYVLQWEALRNAQITGGSEPAFANQYASEQLINVLGYNIYNIPDNELVGNNGRFNPTASSKFEGLNWWDEIERVGQRSEFNMSYSGANDRTDYYTSLNYFKEDGFIEKSDFRRFTGRLHINSKVTPWLKTGINLAATRSDGNIARAGISNSFVNPFFSARFIGPIYPVFAQNMQIGGFLLDSQGNRIYDSGDLLEFGLPQRAAGAFPGRNVVQETRLNEGISDRKSISTRAYVEAVFLQNFSFRFNVSNDGSTAELFSYTNTIIGDGEPGGGAGSTIFQTDSYTINQLLTYSKTFNQKHFIDVLAGHESYDNRFRTQYISKQDQILQGNIE
jgi:TonB-dependent SusC/RagA subfamily outer membrane receptor